MLFNLLTIFLSCLILTWSADKLIVSACALAKLLNVAPLVIGLTIIAFGTSLPEIIVSILASLDHNESIAIGNAIGSNIANIGFIFGLCLVLFPFQVDLRRVRVELIIFLMSSIGITGLIWAFGLQRLTGVLMLSACVAFIGWLVFKSIRYQHAKVETIMPSQKGMHSLMAIFWLLLGLSLLLISAHLLITNATAVAMRLGVSDVIIGLTIVALGTSLPELATTIAAIRKKETDLALGNILGSNIFNLTAVLSAPALIKSIGEIDSRILFKDLPWMIGFTVLLFVIVIIQPLSRGMLARVMGGICLLLYATYIISLVGE